MENVMLLATLSRYPAEALLSVISKEQFGLLIIVFYIAAFLMLILVMRRCGKSKTKSNR